MLELSPLFQDALKSSATHRRSVASAKKQALASAKDGREAQVAFCESFKQCLFVLLSLKKGTSGVDRVLKFVKNFFEMAYDESDENSVILKPMATFLVEYLLFHLCKGFHAKDKNVRFRICQILCLLFDFLEEAEDDLVKTLIENLYMRTFDKEPAVRAHAIAALVVLMDSGDAEENHRCSTRLVDMLRFDSSSEVRKAAFWNLPISAENMDYFVQRSRDTDATIRKSVYLRMCDPQFDVKLLNKEKRTLILKNGLFDRDQNVKKACLKFLCEKLVGNADIFDILTTVDVDDPSCTEAAIKSFFLSKPEVSIPFDETIWENLNAQTSFILRVYAVYCHENKLEEQLENCLPNVLKHVELLQKHVKLALESDDEDFKVQNEFIFGQLLHLTELQDYTDELGRSEMRSTIRNFMVSLDLPEEILEPMVQTIKLTATNDRDFVTMLVEVLHDASDSQENLEDLEKAMVLMKCLDIIKCLFSLMEKNFTEAGTLDGILDTFIVPALSSSNDLLCLQALSCLALSFLVDSGLAKRKLEVFVKAFESENPEYQKISLKILFDLATFHGFKFFDECCVSSEQVLQIFKQSLESEDETVLTQTVEGMSKLFLFKYLEDTEMLQVLIILYFHPSTSQFLRLRQCLTYFFQVFAHSSHRNQLLLKDCILPAIDFLSQQSLTLTMVQQMVDWIDIRKLVNQHEHAELLHDQFAESALLLALEDSGNASKLLCQVMPSLKLDGCKANQKKKLLLFGTELKTKITDTLAMNALKKFTNSIQLTSTEEAEIDPMLVKEILDQLKQLQ